MEQKVTLGEWITIGNIHAVVCQLYVEPNRAIVVYLHNKKSIARDVILSNGEWKFEFQNPDGKDVDNVPMYSEYISILKRGRFP